MDCKKIGKYIKIKRMRVGLTQDELGDKLGVTGKAVSKWECGVALPDVSLFNDLANILQIDVSELLTGEDSVKKEIDYKNRRFMYRLGIIIFVLLILVIFFGSFFINNYNKVHVYDLVSAHSDFYIEGKLITVGSESYLSISEARYLKNKYNNDLIVSNFSYQLVVDEKVLYKYFFPEAENANLNYFINYIDVFVNENGNLYSMKDSIKLIVNFSLEDVKNEKYKIPLEIRR